MQKHRVLWVLGALLLGIWPHLGDPPLQMGARDEPPVVSTSKSLAASFPNVYLFMLILRLFFTFFVVFFSVFIGIVLFIFFLDNSCGWNHFLCCFRRTWTFELRRDILLLLLLGHAARIPCKTYRASPQRPLGCTATSVEFRDFVSVVPLTSTRKILYFRDGSKINRIRRADIKNHELSRVKRMLLLTSGSVEQ